MLPTPPFRGRRILQLIHILLRPQLAFRLIPVEGDSSGVSTIPPEEGIDPRFVIQAADWRLSLRHYTRKAADIACGLSVTNLGDRQRNLYLASASRGGSALDALRSLGVATFIDEEGNAYHAESLSVNGKEGPSSGQGTWAFQPYERSDVMMLFRSVPLSLKRVARFDVTAAHPENNQYQKIPVRYTEVPIEVTTAAGQTTGAAASDPKAAAPVPTRGKK
jgi:hypothetical protein